MHIISYSDLHLEFAPDIILAPSQDADVMILAGDIISLQDFTPLKQILGSWNKPVLFVAGNHEYYTYRAMSDEDAKFKLWLTENYPKVQFLLDDAVTLDGVNFFGGTMWTDFNGANQQAMAVARRGMNDFRLIKNAQQKTLTPRDTVEFHQIFTTKLLSWLDQDLSGPRVVISHHAPVQNPRTQYLNSPLGPAFTARDMLPVIEKYQPDLWIYGHTHECVDHLIGKTRIISNQLGYAVLDGYECKNFDPTGLQVSFNLHTD
jgi:predicted phosphodiesterase